MIDYWADELVTPLKRGGFLRLRPGRLRVSAGRIVEVSKASAAKLKNVPRSQRKGCVIPGLIDSHTHLVFGGSRSDEWGLRLKGASYQQIAKQGGGIKKSVQQTREADAEDLFVDARKNLKEMLRLGVTTVESKSGYGLNLKTELKILRVNRQLSKVGPQEVVSTFMAAHAIPEEFRSSKAYVAEIICDYLPVVKDLAEFQDVFCERDYFSSQEAMKILEAGRALGLKPKVHAHEFGRTGGVSVAAAVGAVSADHLIHMSPSDISALRKAKVVAVLLPGTSFFLGAKKFALARALLDAGVRVALATDFNPGTNPCLNLPLVGTFAAIYLQMTLEEILTAQTWNAALALDRFDRGTLETNQRADFVCLDANRFEEMYYRYGQSLVETVVIRGKKVL